MKNSRIMIFGRSGSGKSTFAFKLHKATGIPLHHLDKYFYTDHWQERDTGEFMEIQYELVEKQSWIIDGNSVRTLSVRWMCADIAIYFNYPRRLCYWRVLKRFVMRRVFGVARYIDDRAANCPEIISWSLLKYMWDFDKRVAPTLTLLRDVMPNVIFYEVRNDAQLKKVMELCISF